MNERDEDLKVLHAMRRHGGGFVRALAEAGFAADSDNLRRIKAAWPEYWKGYKAMAEADEAEQKIIKPCADGDIRVRFVREWKSKLTDTSFGVGETADVPVESVGQLVKDGWVEVVRDETGPDAASRIKPKKRV